MPGFCGTGVSYEGYEQQLCAELTAGCTRAVVYSPLSVTQVVLVVGRYRLATIILIGGLGCLERLVSMYTQMYVHPSPNYYTRYILRGVLHFNQSINQLCWIMHARLYLLGISDDAQNKAIDSFPFISNS